MSVLDPRTQQLRDAIDARSPDTWGEVCESPFGGPTTVFSMAEFAFLHMMYHDGQLNYLHTLHGDTQMHWQPIGKRARFAHAAQGFPQLCALVSSAQQRRTDLFHRRSALGTPGKRGRKACVTRAKRRVYLAHGGHRV